MPPSLLTNPTFPSQIRAQVVRAGLHPRQLTLEITEDALRLIPLDAMKIGRGFTSDVGTNPHTRRFRQALLTMGHDLGLRVIVEGVERGSQADVLRSLGTTHAQGYLYARPAPAEDLDLSTALTRNVLP